MQRLPEAAGPSIEEYARLIEETAYGGESLVPHRAKLELLLNFAEQTFPQAVTDFLEASETTISTELEMRRAWQAAERVRAKSINA